MRRPTLGVCSSISRPAFNSKTKRYTKRLAPTLHRETSDRLTNVHFKRSNEAKKIFRPLLGGAEKLQADCLVVTNSANCFVLFIVNSTKSFVKPVVTTVIGYTSFTTKIVSPSMVLSRSQVTGM